MPGLPEAILLPYFLCQHLDYSVKCRLKLQAAAFRCAPAPGSGNKKADHGDALLGATKQAYGPADAT